LAAFGMGGSVDTSIQPFRKRGRAGGGRVPVTTPCDFEHGRVIGSCMVGAVQVISS
jgi:hypothetical protein